MVCVCVAEVEVEVEDRKGTIIVVAGSWMWVVAGWWSAERNIEGPGGIGEMTVRGSEDAG